MNNESKPSLWWVLEPDNSFSTLPTGPFLAPAIILWGLIYLGRLILRKHHTHESIAGYLAATKTWQDRKKRYEYLLKERIKKDGNIDYHDLMEYRRLEAYLRNPHNY